MSGCVTLVQKEVHAMIVDSTQSISHQTIRSSSETQSVPQASSLVKAPRDTDLRHLPEASLTVDEHQGPPHQLQLPPSSRMTQGKSSRFPHVLPVSHAFDA
jgi:hypothetical protein